MPSSIRDKLISGHETLREYHVEALNETVYAKRYTLAMQKQIQPFYDSQQERLKPEALAEIVVRFALDEEGVRLFSRDDVREFMRKADLHVISDIANWIVGGDQEETDVATLEKKSDGADTE